MKSFARTGSVVKTSSEQQFSHLTMNWVKITNLRD